MAPDPRPTPRPRRAASSTKATDAPKVTPPKEKRRVLNDGPTARARANARTI